MSPVTCRSSNLLFRAVPLLVVLSLVPVTATAGPVSGEVVYRQRCAACHDQTNPRIPPRTALSQMPATAILRALDFGVMMTVAYPLTREERQAVATFLGTNRPIAPSATAFCGDRRVVLARAPATAWNGWSAKADNARFQSASNGGLSGDHVSSLGLRWAFGFEGDVTALAPPTVIDKQIFVGSAGGVIYALRADTGCLQWTFQANGPVRTAIVVAPLGTTQALLFGDQTGWFYGVTAETGRLLWKRKVHEHDAARLTGAAAVHEGIAFVPIASWEETRALDSSYACCTFRGGVAALRVRDGHLVWRTVLVTETPKQTGTTERGTPQFGPSGVPVWATPTVDAGRGALYVATGNNYSSPATTLSDAIISLDLSSGRILWAKQTTSGDAFSSSCLTDKQNCPTQEGPDSDYASSVVMTKLPDGRDVLLAAQKSGMLYALDPSRKGEILWRARAAKGGPTGGVQWGIATDGRLVYAAASDPVRRTPTDPLDTRRFVFDPGAGGGLTAFAVSDGRTVWSTPGIPCAANAPSGCNPAQSAAVTAIPGVVFSGSNDGHIRAYSATDGHVVWDFNTARDFTAVNGVKAKGGTLDGAGPVIANGMLFVNSGYARFGGMPGNVLLAFAPVGSHP
jgi:polyvinyl alcohol dehydrogenase (cytochrome)